MKKGSWFFLLSPILFVLVISLVSANPLSDVINSLVSGIYDVLEPFLDIIAGPSDSESVFMAKILLFIILFGAVYSVLGTVDFFSNQKWVLWTISIAVSVLGIRFLDDQLINTILVPYSALGVAITAGLPFVIYFIFVEKGLSGPTYKVARRIGWIFFAIVFLAIYSVRQADIPQYAWIYSATALVAIIVLLLDGTIQKFFFNLKLEKAGVQNKEELISSLMEKINKLDELVAQGIISNTERIKRRKKYRAEIAALTE